LLLVSISVADNPDTAPRHSCSSGPILIAGKSGRVAQALVAEAARLGVAVKAAGRPELDIERPETIARVMMDVRPCAVINTAAVGVVDEAEGDPRRAFTLNRDGAARLAAAAAETGIPFLHLSTDWVFDGDKRTPYVEEDPPAPLNAYGRSKLAGEQAVLAAYPAALVFRTAWVFGPEGANFLTAMLRIAAAEGVARVVTDQYGSPTLGADLGRALLELAARLAAAPPPASAGIYHLAGRDGTSWWGLAEAIFSGWARRGHRVPRIERIALADWPSPARRPHYSVLDCSKVERVFGIRLPGFADAVERCLDAIDRGNT
jgi:dTDP-4-dehydrorhamnose reductase